MMHFVKQNWDAVDWVERAAVGASLACMVHCLALPLLLAALPVLSSVLAVPEDVHLWILAFAVPSASIALVTGWSRHGDLRPLAFGAIGLSLLAIGALVFSGSPGETLLTVAGSLVLATAHLGNWRLRHAFRH